MYEKIRQAVEGKSAASAVKSKIMAWALKTGKSIGGRYWRGKTPGVGELEDCEQAGLFEDW